MRRRWLVGGRAPQVVLYGREGCHLCEEALEGLIELRRQGLAFDLIEVDIESEESLHRTLLELIPVIEIDGERFSELIPDLDALRSRLATVEA
jgi:glutaredoxin